MEHIYWVIDHQLAGRAGPVRYPWDARAFYEGGIRVVISLAAEEPVEDLTVYGLEHYRAQLPPVLLFSAGMRKAFIHQSLPVWAYIHQQLEAAKPTLVHCHAGKDRTGVILAGYLIIYLGMAVEDAIAKVRAANPEALSAFGFEEAVRLLRPGQMPDPRRLL